MVHYLDWDDNERPRAFLITFRTYGTWLHGDERFSVDRHNGKNIYGEPKIAPNTKLNLQMSENRARLEFLLDAKCRKIVDGAIRRVCEHRNYFLSAINVRTNHAHSVVTGPDKPEKIMNAFKSNATRELRAAGLVSEKQQVWSRGGSTRYLWKQHHFDAAVEYVRNGQGDDLPDFV